ncbi:MAG: carbohydrate ABC transporter permease [Actinobacteria bacterium]|nr:carbohydrate ABC transporter permease [Actinomycetota bacterium]
MGSGKINITIALGNSLRVAIITTILCIILGIFAAYAFARLKFKFANVIFISLIFTQMIPPVSLLLPFYLIFKRFDLVNTLSGLVIFYTAWLLPVATWILYSYYRTIPKELEDSARIDGASRIGALFKIIVPLSLPGIISAGIICFVFSMSEFMGAVALINKSSVQTAPLALFGFISKYTIEFGGITASAVLFVIFPVIFVLLFQRFLIKGLTAGAVKE